MYVVYTVVAGQYTHTLTSVHGWLLMDVFSETVLFCYPPIGEIHRKH